MLTLPSAVSMLFGVMLISIAASAKLSGTTKPRLSEIWIRSEMSLRNRRISNRVAATEVLLRAEVPELSKPLVVLVPALVVWELDQSDTPSSEVIKSYAEEKAFAKARTPSFSRLRWPAV